MPDYSLADVGEVSGAPVSNAVIASQPSTMAVSESIDKSATSALLGTMQQTTATNPYTASAATTGTAVAPDENGIPQAIIGQYGQTPNQMEAAGVLKPGSAALVNSAVAGGADVEAAMTPNLFTGQHGINNLNDYVNSSSVQATVAVTSLQQSQTQLTSAGVITGREHSTQISGLVLAGATVGIAQTLNTVNSINQSNFNTASSGYISSVPPAGYGVRSSSPLSVVGGASATFSSGGLSLGVSASSVNRVSGISVGVSGRSGSLLGSVSGSFNSLTGGSIYASVGSISGFSSRIMGTIGKGNFAAASASISVGSLGGLSLSLSALSRTPSLSSLTASVRGASASAFYAIAASFKPMQAGVPQNLTVLARASALNTSGASSIGGSLSISNGLNSLTGSISGAISGSAGGLGIGSISGSLGGLGTRSSLSALGTARLPISGGGVAQGIVGYNSSTGLSGAVSASTNIPGLGRVSASLSTSSVNNLIPTVGGYANPTSLVNSSDGRSTGLYQTAQAMNSGALQGSVSSLASGVNHLPGGAGSISSIVNNATNSTMSIPGLSSISSLAKNASASALNNTTPSTPLSMAGMDQSIAANLNNITPDLSASLPNIPSSIDAADGNLSALASTGLSAGDASQLESSISSLGSGGASPVKMPTVAMNTVDRSDITAGIADQLGDPGIPPPNFQGEASPVAISEVEQIQQQEASATDAVDQINTYNDQVQTAYDTYSQSLTTYPQGDPRIQQAKQSYEALANSPQLAQLYNTAGIADA